jgi:hypothetical protein
MLRRNFILILVATGLIVVGALSYIYFKGNANGATGPTSLITKAKSLFPFGTIDKNTFVAEQPLSPTPQTVGDIPSESAPSMLHKLSDAPVAGFIVLSKVIPKPLAPTTDSATPATTDANTSIQNPFAAPVPVPQPTTTVKGKKVKIVLPAIQTISIPIVRYIERATGNMYEVRGDTYDVTRITNTTIPRVSEALIGNGGQTGILRSEGDSGGVDTFVGSLPGTLMKVTPVAKSKKKGQSIAAPSVLDTTVTTSTTDTSTANNPLPLNGNFIQGNLLDMVLSPLRDKFFALHTTGDETDGIVSTLTTSAQTTVFKSSFSEWLPQWYADSSILLTTKASGLAKGYAYILDTNKRTMDKIIGDILGLTVNARADGKLFIIGQASATSYHIKLLTPSGTLTDTTYQTLPEKCIFTKTTFIYCAIPDSLPKALYPDAWYQGAVSFSDSLWRIDTATGNGEKLDIGDLPDSDITNLALSTDEKNIFWVNKKDSSLWEYQVSQ